MITGWASPRSSSLVGWWLAAWLGYTYTDQAAGRVLPTNGEIDISTLEAGFIPLQATSTALAVIACVLWMRIISDIMRGQAELGRAPVPAQPAHWPAP